MEVRPSPCGFVAPTPTTLLPLASAVIAVRTKVDVKCGTGESAEPHGQGEARHQRCGGCGTR